jgi:hypothetical protein
LVVLGACHEEQFFRPGGRRCESRMESDARTRKAPEVPGTENARAGIAATAAAGIPTISPAFVYIVSRLAAYVRI